MSDVGCVVADPVFGEIDPRWKSRQTSATSVSVLSASTPSIPFGTPLSLHRLRRLDGRKEMVGVDRIDDFRRFGRSERSGVFDMQRRRVPSLHVLSASKDLRDVLDLPMEMPSSVFQSTTL